MKSTKNLGASVRSRLRRLADESGEDFQLFGDPDEGHIRKIFHEILMLEVDDDGIFFDLETLMVGPIREDQAYGGVRVEVVAHLTSARVSLQVDVGFGDAITPDASMMEFPPLLDFPAPWLRAYPRETVIDAIRAFIETPLRAAARGTRFTLSWRAGTWS